MTENKRFTDIWCSETGDIGFTYDGVDLTFKGDSLETFLNELVEENEQLRHDATVLIQANTDYRKENAQLKETIEELELENAKHIGDGEWDIRDITYGHGKFRLEEWGERYHQFYNGDEKLEDEEVVSLLFENEQLKSTNMEYEDALGRFEERIKELEEGNDNLCKSIVMLQHKLTESKQLVLKLKDGDVE